MGERGRPRGRRAGGAGRRRPGGEGGQEPNAPSSPSDEPRWGRHAAPRGQPSAESGEPAGESGEPAGEPSQEPAAQEPPATLRGPGEGRADRRRAAKRIKRRRRLRATREIPILIGTALLIALFLKTFLVQAFVIPSGSMEQTIKIDDRVLVDKLTPWFGWEPSRGDVVVFKDPGGWLDQEPAGEVDDPPMGIKQVKDALTWIGLLPSQDDQDLIKRVIAVGGDTVVCCDEGGRITVNGAALDEPYLYPGNPPSQIEFDVEVPQGRLFVMGDHRSNSADSRYHLDDPGQGTVPEDLVVGRAMVIAWPFGHWQRLGDTEAFSGVPEPGSGTVDARGSGQAKEKPSLPIPAELPLVMGVVGLLRPSDGSLRSKRSGCGGCGGGCAIQRGGAGGASSGESDWRAARRWSLRRAVGRRRRRRRRARGCRGGADPAGEDGSG